MLGGIALVAIGASMGSLLLVISGLLLLGAGIAFGKENDQLQSWVDSLGLNSVQEFVVIAVILGGIAMVAIGAATANILLVIAGLVLIGVAIWYAAQSGMMQDWAETTQLPKGVVLSESEHIYDTSLYVRANINDIKQHYPDEFYNPAITRLYRLKEFVEGSD